MNQCGTSQQAVRITILQISTQPLEMGTQLHDFSCAQ